jgi:hypothetical protein
MNVSYHTYVLIWTIHLVIIACNPLCVFLYWPVPSWKYCPFEVSKCHFHVLGHRSIFPYITQDTSHHSFIYFYFTVPMNAILNSWNFVVRNRIFWQPQFNFAGLSIHYSGRRNQNEAFHQCYVLIRTVFCVILSVDIVVKQHTENPNVNTFMSDA